MDDEYDGDTIIQQIHRIVLDGTPLQAEWCTDSRPVLLQNATRLTIDAHPNHSFYCHCNHGLVMVLDHENDIEYAPAQWALLNPDPKKRQPLFPTTTATTTTPFGRHPW